MERRLVRAQLRAAAVAGVVRKGSGGRTRTYGHPINSRTLCQLSYAGSIFITGWRTRPGVVLR
jgi:hypothetical protein